MSKKVVLAGAVRTAIGKMGGALTGVPAEQLGTIVIKEALSRAGVKPEQVDEVLMGCVIQAGLGQNVARQASIHAGRPGEGPAVTLDVVCGSGMNEGPRAGVTAEGIAKLKPAFKRDGGTVTAANASGINDGAACVVVMSEEKAKELGVKPMATWVAGALGGVDPSIMGVGPVAACKKVFKKTGLGIDDFDLIEANEAFAAQALAVGKELKWNAEKVNVNGGAIALGHPVGASGCRILVTLLHEMQKRDAKRGLATLCIGGGMGCATIVEKYEG